MDPLRWTLGPVGLCALLQRLRRPLVREGGELVETSWDQAMDRIVERSRQLLETTGGAFGFYTSGQLFAEEYYTLAVIGKAGLGTPHTDGNTRRPADGREHPRVRRRRRPPGVPELAQPGPHRRAGRALERRPHDHPHWAPPTHAMQIWRHAEQGSIKLLWISATNPAVSLPELAGSGPSWRHPSRSWSSRTPS